MSTHKTTSILVVCFGVFVSCSDGLLPRENTVALCTNSRDDDQDGFVDCQDQDCFQFERCANDTEQPLAPSDAGADQQSDVAGDFEGDLAGDLAGGDQAGDLQSCSSQCDCPGGTICTVEQVCIGTPCSKPCSSSADCPCNRACSGGFCEPHVGNLSSCTHDCHCTDGERCASGHCVNGCGFNPFKCSADSDCSACGLICNLGSMKCVPPGYCKHGMDCPTQPPGVVCVSKSCQTPPGTRYQPASGIPAAIGSVASNPPTITLPAATTINTLVVLVDVEYSSLDSDIMLRLMGPSGDVVHLWYAGVPAGYVGRFREAFPLTLAVASGDLSIFEGKDGAGTWKLLANHNGSGSASLVDWALYIQ